MTPRVPIWSKLEPCLASSVIGDTDTILSLVFIHGITGHREHTWAAPGSRPWPEKLLPTKMPQARILSFGYDAGVIGWRSRLSGNRVGDHAKNLLSALAAHREADDTVRFPRLNWCLPKTHAIPSEQKTHHICLPQPRRPRLSGCRALLKSQPRETPPADSQMHTRHSLSRDASLWHQSRSSWPTAFPARGPGVRNKHPAGRGPSARLGGVGEDTRRVSLPFAVARERHQHHVRV